MSKYFNVYKLKSRVPFYQTSYGPIKARVMKICKQNCHKTHKTGPGLFFRICLVMFSHIN